MHLDEHSDAVGFGDTRGKNPPRTGGLGADRTQKFGAYERVGAVA